MMRGFTLVEVLVALALMALLSVMGWRALDVLERSHTRMAAHTDDTQTLQGVMAQIVRDLHQHANRDVLAPAPPEARAAQANQRSAGAQALPPALHVEPQSLTLVRAQAAGAWQQVHWYARAGVLYRASGAARATLPLPAPDHVDAVLDKVRALTLRAWLPGRGWTALPVSSPAPAADGLEIVLVREGSQGEESYRHVVLLP